MTKAVAPSPSHAVGADPIPSHMRAVVKASAAPGARMETVPVPAIGPRDVLVKVTAATICGTDMHIYNWDPWAYGRVHPPLVFGHEFAGQVVAVGDEVSEVALGDFVSAETHIVCNRCLACRTGNSHVCENVQIIGVDRSGSYAEYVAIPATNAWKNDPAMPQEVAAVQEPMGNAVHTTLAGDVAARHVAVIGCGPIGIFAVGVARAAGAASVIAIDVNPYRLELAMRLGASLAIDAREEDPVATVRRVTGGHGADVVLEMSGNARAIKQGFAMIRNGGRYSMLGIPSRPVELDLADDVIFKGLTVQGISGRRMYQTWYQTSELLNSGRVDVMPVITHRFPLDRFEEAMALMNAGQCGKVVLLP